MKIANDKILHFCACFVVSLCTASIEAFCGGSFVGSLLAGVISGIAIGVGKEYGDLCAEGNRWDWSDIAADGCGTAVGASCGSLIALII